jgi:hypothetical protein
MAYVGTLHAIILISQSKTFSNTSVFINRRVYKGAYSVFIADNEDERIWDRSLMVIWNLILFIVTVRFALA